MSPPPNGFPALDGRRRKVLVVLVAAAVALAVYWYGHGRAATVVTTTLAWIRAQGAWAWVPLILLQVAVCLVGVAPASLVVLASGGLYGLGYGFCLATVATFAGGVSAFAAGRYLVGRLARSRLATQISLPRLNEEITARGWRFAFLLRMSPLFPFGLLSYGFGLSDIRWRHFLVGNLGSLPAIFALTYTGAVANNVAGLAAGQTAAGGTVQSVAFALGLVATVAIVSVLGKVTYGVVRQLRATVPIPDTPGDSGAGHDLRVHTQRSSTHRHPPLSGDR